MPYPSTLTTFTTPTPSDKLNSPSHSSVEGTQNTALSEVQAFLGTLSSAAGTLIYDIRAAASDGGGHVQSANKGGTGQTSYTKGDLLVAASSSVLNKLSVGSDNQVLTADSTQSSGVKWGNLVKIGQNASIVTVTGNTTETSILSVTIPASTLSTANAVRANLYVSAYTVGGASDTLTLRANYGSNSLGSVVLSASGASSASIKGKIELALLANASQSAQRGELLVDLLADRLNVLQSSVVGVQAFRSGTASVNSMANQTLGITAQWAASIAGSRLDIDGYTVEKIT